MTAPPTTSASTTTVPTTSAATTAAAYCCKDINTAVTSVCAGTPTMTANATSYGLTTYSKFWPILGAYGTTSNGVYPTTCSDATTCTALPSGFTGSAASVALSAMSVLLACIFALALLF